MIMRKRRKSEGVIPYTGHADGNLIPFVIASHGFDNAFIRVMSIAAATTIVLLLDHNKDIAHYPFSTLTRRISFRPAIPAAELGACPEAHQSPLCYL